MLDLMSAADFSSDWKKDLDQTLQPEEYYYDAMQVFDHMNTKLFF
jgi:hypothetical protein